MDGAACLSGDLFRERLNLLPPHQVSSSNIERPRAPEPFRARHLLQISGERGGKPLPLAILILPPPPPASFHLDRPKMTSRALKIFSNMQNFWCRPGREKYPFLKAHTSPVPDPPGGGVVRTTPLVTDHPLGAIFHFQKPVTHFMFLPSDLPGFA